MGLKCVLSGGDTLTSLEKGLQMCQPQDGLLVLVEVAWGREPLRATS